MRVNGHRVFLRYVYTRKETFAGCSVSARIALKEDLRRGRAIGILIPDVCSVCIRIFVVYECDSALALAGMILVIILNDIAQGVYSHRKASRIPVVFPLHKA